MIVTIGLSLAMQYAFQYYVTAGGTVRVVVGDADRAPVRLGQDHQPVAGLRWGSRSWCWAWSATRCCAPASAGPRARSSDNPALAQASGIDTDKVIRLVWTVAMALAGLVGPALRARRSTA